MTYDLRQRIMQNRRNRKAIPAFNYSDMWDLMAIADAGADTGVPMIVASNPLVVEMLGLKLCAAMVVALAEEYQTQLYNHLDHSKQVDLCIQAVEAGYQSVMIDGSDKDLETNIAMTKEVVRYAHKKHVMVEAEIGRIKGRGTEGDFTDTDFLARVDDAVALAGRTGVDALAVGIGTAHGFYVGEPKIDFGRLAEIAAKVDIPLVLHGGTGVPDQDIHRGINLGISKVNVGTIIHVTYMNTLKQALGTAGGNPYTLDVMKKVLPSVKAVVIDRINVIAR